MPHDSKGQVIEKGDRVTARGKVTRVWVEVELEAPADFPAEQEHMRQVGMMDARLWDKYGKDLRVGSVVEASGVASDVYGGEDYCNVQVVLDGPEEKRLTCEVTTNTRLWSKDG